MGSREFAAQTFRWLNQVNWDLELHPIDVKVAVQLTCHFNEEEDGRAWPSYKYIGDKIGVSERTVLRSVHRMHKLGHLRVKWGARGRGKPNHYWMTEKNSAAVEVSTSLHTSKKTGTVAPVSTPLHASKKPAQVRRFPMVENRHL